MVSILHRKLWRDLRDLKSQVITIALVVATGVAVLVGALSTYNSLDYARSHFYQNYHFADIFSGLKRAPESLRTRIETIPGVAQVETRIMREVTIDMPQVKEPVVGLFISQPEGHASRLNRLHLRYGRLLAPHRDDEILVSEAFAKEHKLKPGNTIKAIVNGHYEQFQIVGIVLSPEFIYSIRGSSIIPDNQHFGVFWLNEDGMAAAFGMKSAFNHVTLSLTKNANHAAVQQQLDDLLDDYGSLGSQTRDEQLSHRFVENEFRELQFLATMMPAIFLGVAAFLLNIVTGRLVVLQREHIGILKAQGYSNVTIGAYYLKLVAAIVLLGTLIGIGFGAWMGNAMTGLYKQYFVFPVFHYLFDWRLPIIGAGISLTAALSGALGAAIWVAKLPPSEAMRPPAPKAYQHTWLERLNLFKKLKPANKMIARYFLRRPIRNFLTIVGIGFGVGIVVMGLFWQDSINHLIYTQFGLAEREHALITFTDPIHDRALREISHLPGVLAAEGNRTVAVRVRAKQRSYLTGLYGFNHSSAQRLLLNRELQSIHVPAGQLLVSEGLADILHLTPGDTVWLDVLEGKRPQFAIKLAGTVDDFIGQAAYINADQLARLMEEKNQVSSVSVLVDPQQRNTFFQKLKEMPRVATVTLKAAIIHMFEKTFAEHLLVFTGFLTGFAIVIAVGIVYNSARIALSERAWELASLRVLGFTHSEVSKLMFGELSIQLILGIPVGFLIGYSLGAAAIAAIPADLVRIPMMISVQTYGFAAISSFIAAIISAGIIKRRINRLDLVAVLKTMD